MNLTASFFLVNYQSTQSLLHNSQKGNTNTPYNWGKEEEKE